MKMPDPEDITPEEFKLAVDKSRELFETLTWDQLRDQPTVNTTEKALKLAEIIAYTGDLLELKLGVSPEDWGKMLVMGGCSILAARKYGDERKEAKRRSSWN